MWEFLKVKYYLILLSIFFAGCVANYDIINKSQSEYENFFDSPEFREYRNQEYCMINGCFYTNQMLFEYYKYAEKISERDFNIKVSGMLKELHDNKILNEEFCHEYFKVIYNSAPLYITEDYKTLEEYNEKVGSILSESFNYIYITRPYYLSSNPKTIEECYVVVKDNNIVIKAADNPKKYLLPSDSILIDTRIIDDSLENNY